MTLSISFPCKKADFILVELHLHLLDAVIVRISLRLSLVQVGESSAANNSRSTVNDHQQMSTDRQYLQYIDHRDR